MVGSSATPSFVPDLIGKDNLEEIHGSLAVEDNLVMEFKRKS